MISPVRLLSMVHRYPATGNGAPGKSCFLNLDYFKLGAIPLTENQASAVNQLAAEMADGGVFSLVHAETGAGKTHIAIPLLDYAARSGMPSVMLAPTRLLCDQHYAKLAEYTHGLKIGRYYGSYKESGDILVGTTKLLSHPGPFSLLVVDEEQKFGAVAKAKLGARSANVVYLTATPIPRTITHIPISLEQVEGYHFEKLKPQATVKPFKWRKAERFIRQELKRGGQVIWLVHTREQTKRYSNILEDRLRVRSLSSDSSPEEMIEVRDAFDQGEVDLLVATTVIESGIDLPRVGTLIMDEGDMFGLAQLHQILGRVGRAGQQGYAFLGYTKGSSYHAIWRLHACQEDAAQVSTWDAKIRGTGIAGRSVQKGRYLERLPFIFWDGV